VAASQQIGERIARISRIGADTTTEVSAPIGTIREDPFSRLVEACMPCLTVVARAAFGVVLATAAAAAQPATTDTTGAFHRAPDGVRVHYTVAGAGPTVVLVHGFLNDGGSWRSAPLHARLRAAGYRVVVVDLRGNGASDHPTTLAAYERDAEARDVIAIAAALGAGDYCAVGYSRGAIIAARLLVLDPRVRCAVLGGMGADFTDPAWPRREAAYRALAGLPLDSAAAAPVLGMVRAAEQRGLDRTVLALQQRAQPSTSRAELGRVRRPVLVIAGDRDADNGDAAALAALIPGAARATVPGDHGGTMRTAPFADSVLAFLGRASAPHR
jgi:pimeloyl-ACP methyl ester carboxylesterase